METGGGARRQDRDRTRGTCAWGGCGVVFLFSSRRRHTIFGCDWSSDVCSSDLSAGQRMLLEAGDYVSAARYDAALRAAQELVAAAQHQIRARFDTCLRGWFGGEAVAGDRKSRGQGKRGELGGRRSIKKNTITDK